MPRLTRNVAPLILASACAAALSLAGCAGKEASGATVTLTVTPTVTPTSSAPAPAPSTSAKPKPLTHFSGTCDDVLSDYSVAEALGGNPLSGRDDFIVGQPEKDIGRLAYLNCKYAVSGSGAQEKRKIEVGLSLYRDAKAAASRIGGTVTDYSQHGARVSKVLVDGTPGSLLMGAKGAGYTEPLLVVAAGQRTVAVNVTKEIASSSAAVTKATKAIATVALKQTAG